MGVLVGSWDEAKGLILRSEMFFFRKGNVDGCF